MTDTSENCFPI